MTKTRLWKSQSTLLSKKRQRSSHNTGASTLRRTRSPTIYLFQFFLFPQIDLSLCLKAFFWGGSNFDFSLLSFFLRGSVGFQTEVTPFLPIDGVGHQSLSLGKTLSVLFLSLLFESPRCQDLLVCRPFLFQRSFLQFTSCSSFVFPQRETGTFCSTIIRSVFLFSFYVCGMFSPQYIYPQKRTHVYP